MKADIAAAQATLSDITGQAPRFFRAHRRPAQPLPRPGAGQLDLRLAAWTRRPTTPATATRPRAARLTRGLGPGDILLMHDGHAARTPDGHPVILSALPRVLQTCEAAAAATRHPATIACP
jgi:peptidoglycan-N-acetylglucosamine deacetylase